MGHAWVAVQSHQQWPCGSETDCQESARAQVNPEQITGQEMIHLLSLDNGLCISILPETHEYQAECRDHRYHAKIRRHEQSSQDNGRDQLDGKYHALGEHCDPCATHSKATQTASHLS